MSVPCGLRSVVSPSTSSGDSNEALIVVVVVVLVVVVVVVVDGARVNLVVVVERCLNSALGIVRSREDRRRRLKRRTPDCGEARPV